MVRIKQIGRFAAFFISLSVLVGVVALSYSGTAEAAGNKGCGVDTSIIKCDNVDNESNDVTKSGVWSLLVLAINILSVGVGVLAVAGIVYGSVLYTAAGGNADQVKKARSIITNVVIGLIAYALMYAILNYIVPGGLFN